MTKKQVLQGIDNFKKLIDSNGYYVDKTLLIKELIDRPDLNSWGSVNFVSGDVDHGDRVYPAAYLTNDNGDILYKFQAPFQTGLKVIEASIKDINNDGLKDVKITLGFIKDPNLESIEWIFYQMNNGLFYDSRLNNN